MKFFKRFLFLYILIALVFCLNITCFAEGTTYVWSNNSDKIDKSNQNNTIEKNTEISNESTTQPSSETTTDLSKETSASSGSNSIDLKLESPSAILIEQTTGQVLYEHNCHEKLRPASVTKIMSILLIMEQIDSRKA